MLRVWGAQAYRCRQRQFGTLPSIVISTFIKIDKANETKNVMFEIHFIAVQIFCLPYRFQIRLTMYKCERKNATDELMLNTKIYAEINKNRRD